MIDLPFKKKNGRHQYTLLHLAILFQLEQSVKILLKHGANTDIPDIRKQNPYQLALQSYPQIINKITNIQQAGTVINTFQDSNYHNEWLNPDLVALLESNNFKHSQALSFEVLGFLKLCILYDGIKGYPPETIKKALCCLIQTDTRLLSKIVKSLGDRTEKIDIYSTGIPQKTDWCQNFFRSNNLPFSEGYPFELPDSFLWEQANPPQPVFGLILKFSKRMMKEMINRAAYKPPIQEQPRYVDQEPQSREFSDKSSDSKPIFTPTDSKRTVIP